MRAFTSGVRKAIRIASEIFCVISFGVPGGATTPPDEPVPRAGRVTPIARRPVWFTGGRASAAIFRREQLGRGFATRGPAVVCEYSATTLVPPGWGLRVDAVGGLLLERKRRA